MPENVFTNLVREAAMCGLAAHTDLLSSSIPPGARIGYIDYPMHINVGDLLIFLGAMDFFSCNKNDIHTSFCLYDASPRAFGSLEDVDVIVCHGGGNFGDIYPRHQKLREDIVKTFPHKPIVVMPQSFHFGSKAAMEESASVFRRHQNVTMYVRDQPSHLVARRYFSDQVHLSPDMAHRLYDWLAPVRGATTVGISGPLRLMRRDVEAAATQDQQARGMDWRDIMRLTEKFSIGRHRLRAQMNGRAQLSSPKNVHDYHATVRQVVDKIAKRVIYNNPWVTSRLHGAIFGLLLDRKVEMIDNSYGKNSRYFSQWGPSLVG
jgi:pyruvyl transferase EpsO